MNNSIVLNANKKNNVIVFNCILSKNKKTPPSYNNIDK